MVSVEKLSGFPLLAGLESSFIEKLFAIAMEISLVSGEWLFHEGEGASALYLVESGTVALRFHLDRSRDIYVDLKTLGAGNAIGWSALVPPYVYSMGAMANSDAHLIRIDGEALRALVEAHPEQGYGLMQGIAQEMASRLTTLSEQAPSLSLRLVVSMTLIAIGAMAIFVLFMISIYAGGTAIGGHQQALGAIPVALVCMVVPVALLLLARSIYPGEGKNSARRSQRNSA